MTIPRDLFLRRVDLDGDVVEVSRNLGRTWLVSAPTCDIGRQELWLKPQRMDLRRRRRTSVEIEVLCRTAVSQIERVGEPAMFDLWLDELARAALVELIWILPHAQSGAFVCIRGAEVHAESVVTDVEHLAALTDAVAVFATRPHRLGRTLAALADELGGRAVGATWNLHDFALLLPSASGTVTVDHRRTPIGKLRTRARAARGLLDEATLQTRLRDLHARLRRAGVIAHTLDGEHLVIEADGAIVDRERLAELVELVARLVEPAGGTAPYR